MELVSHLELSLKHAGNNNNNCLVYNVSCVVSVSHWLQPWSDCAVGQQREQCRADVQRDTGTISPLTLVRTNHPRVLLPIYRQCLASPSPFLLILDVSLHSFSPWRSCFFTATFWILVSPLTLQLFRRHVLCIVDTFPLVVLPLAEYTLIFLNLVDNYYVKWELSVVRDETSMCHLHLVVSSMCGTHTAKPLLVDCRSRCPVGEGGGGVSWQCGLGGPVVWLLMTGFRGFVVLVAWLTYP